MKPQLFTKSSLSEILVPYSKINGHITDKILVDILCIALEQHIKGTSTSMNTINRNVFVRKIKLTNKVLTTPYAINYAINEVLFKH